MLLLRKITIKYRSSWRLVQMNSPYIRELIVTFLHPSKTAQFLRIRKSIKNSLLLRHMAAVCMSYSMPKNQLSPCSTTMAKHLFIRWKLPMEIIRSSSVKKRPLRPALSTASGFLLLPASQQLRQQAIRQVLSTIPARWHWRHKYRIIWVISCVQGILMARAL